MMTKNRCSKLLAFVALSLSTCFAGSCATGLRDAALAGMFDFTSGTVNDTLASVVSATGLLGGTQAEQ